MNASNTREPNGLKSNQSQSVAWLTGASSGIGLALAKQLSNDFDLVLISGRNVNVLTQLAEQYSNIHAIPFDVTQESEIEPVRCAIELHTLTLNAVYMNAGTCEYLDIDEPDWTMAKRVMDVNYLGAINTLAVAIPLLERQGEIFVKNNKQNVSDKPHIVGISSLASLLPFTKAEFYGASKAALSYFLKSLRMDLAAKNIDVSTVLPGFVRTPLTDKNTFSMPFIMSAEEAAQRIQKGLRSRPFSFAFPKRLHWLLVFWSCFPKSWEKRMSAKGVSSQTVYSENILQEPAPSESLPAVREFEKEKSINK